MSTGPNSNWWHRFWQMSWMDRLNLVGAIASILSLLIAIPLAFWPGSTILAPIFSDHVSFFLFLLTVVAIIIIVGTGLRLFMFVMGLSRVPLEQRNYLIQVAFGAPSPGPVTAQEARLTLIVRCVFFFALCVLIASLVSLVFWIGHLDKISEDAKGRAEAEDKEHGAENLAAERRTELDKKDTELDRFRTQIDKLQADLEAARERDGRRLVLAAEANGEIAIAAHNQPSPETLAAAAKLKEVLKEFESNVDRSRLSKEDDLRIRLSEGTIANVEQRFRDALNAVTAEDAAAEHDKTETQIDREYKLSEVRAVAFYGLHQWEDARSAYGRMAELRPSSVGAQSGKARCLFFLGKLKDALDIWDALLAKLTGQFDHGSLDLGADIAAGFANRAAIHCALGQAKEAKAEAWSAVSMFQLILNKRDSPLQRLDLAKTLVLRGGLQADLGDPQAGLKDFQAALDLVQKLAKNGDLGPVDIITPFVLHDRATVLVESGKLDEALADLDSAVKLESEISAHPGYEYIRGDLAQSYATRGIVWMERDQLANAVDDLSRAVDSYQNLVDSGRLEEFVLPLIMALRQRAAALSLQGKLKEAMNDLQAASDRLAPFFKDMAKKVVPEVVAEAGVVAKLHGETLVAAATENLKKEDREKLLTEGLRHESAAVAFSRQVSGATDKVQYQELLASALESRSVPFYRLGRTEDAKKDAEEACRLFGRLMGMDTHSPLRLDYSKCMISIGIAYVDGGDFEQGIERINQAIELQRQMVDDGKVSVQGELAQSLQIRGRVFSEHKQTDNALKDLNESVSLCRQMIDKYGRDDLKGVLDRSSRFMRNVQNGLPVDSRP